MAFRADDSAQERKKCARDHRTYTKMGDEGGNKEASGRPAIRNKAKCKGAISEQGELRVTGGKRKGMMQREQIISRIRNVL